MDFPASLKGKVDAGRFALRGAQLENIKPQVAYWSYFYIVHHIIDKKLHADDEEVNAYTNKIVDKLEEIKRKHPGDEAMNDEVIGQECVEKFGHDLMMRAENAMRGERASKQTADTLQVAAACFEITKIWGPLKPEFSTKTKYAKYHALRILKALKAGEDPNASNPFRGLEPGAPEKPLDPNDPEVRKVMGLPPLPQPTVEEAPDQEAGTPAGISETGTAPSEVLPATTPEAPPVAPDAPTTATYDVSPQQQPSVNSRQNSVGGGYFPDVSPASQPTIPATQDVDVPTPPALDDAPPSIPPVRDLNDAPPAAAISPPPAAVAPFPAAVVQSPPPAMPPPVMYQAPVIPPVAPSPVIPQPIAMQPRAPPAMLPVQTTQTYIDDDVAVAEAQKHARWAISALNFEDVPTAVKELRIALQKLGAS